MRTITLTDKQYETVVMLVETRALLIGNLGQVGWKVHEGKSVVSELDEMDALLVTLDGAIES